MDQKDLSRALLVGVAVLAVAGAAFFFYGCNSSSPGKATSPSGMTAPHEHPADSAMYTCPMHPDVVLDHPGKCPICGMTLVPKEKTAEPMDMNHQMGDTGMKHDMGQMGMKGPGTGEADK